MTRKTDVTRPSAPGASPDAMIEAFLDDAKKLAPVGEGDARPRLVFALDATMSRQPTWDLACHLQSEMSNTAAAIGGLSVQLVYFRGFDECRSSRFVADPRALRDLMIRIQCQGGHTQIGRVLRHVRNEAGRKPVKVLVYVGDAMEEPVDDLCAVAGELGLLGVKAFMFQEGRDAQASRAYREVARLTGGSYGRFDGNAPGTLSALLQAAAAFAARGHDGLVQLASHNHQARLLLGSMSGIAG
jgi:hypothetical protein